MVINKEKDKETKEEIGVNSIFLKNLTFNFWL